jgi:hypothetical protein
MRRWVIVASLSVALACGGAPPSAGDPRAALERFLSALEAQRFDEAYAALDPEVRAGLPRARFEALARENKAELHALAEQLARVDAAVRVQARVTTEQGEAVTVVLEEGQYRIAGGVLDAHALATPLDAVSELRRALTRESLPALLRVLSAERRAAWLAAFGDTLERTADPLDLRVEVHGDEAIVRLTGGGEIHLRRQAGEWHVHDVK